MDFMPWSSLTDQPSNTPTMLQGVPFKESPVVLPSRGVASLGNVQPAVNPQGSYTPPVQTNEPRQVGFSQEAAKAQYDARKDFIARYQKYMDEKQKMIESTREKLSSIDNLQTGPDLSGLAMLADQWGGGGKFSAAYRRPTSELDKTKLKADLENKLMSQLGSQADDALNFVRNEDLTQNWKNQAASRAEIQDMKNQAMLDKAMLMAQVKANQPPKPLSEGLMKIKYASEDVIANLDTIDADKLANMGLADRAKVRLALSTGIGDTAESMAIRNIAENYGRMQSGGAISKPEEQRFIDAIFRTLDNPQMTRAKLNYFRNMANRRLEMVNGGADSARTHKVNLDAEMEKVESSFKKASTPLPTMSNNFRAPADTTTSVVGAMNKSVAASSEQSQLARIQAERRKRGL